jgi:beta-lactamase regulating signal transducer with metallopeptidase domain
MLPAWMLYATAIGGLAFITALALEHLLGIWSLPRRAAWVLAMAATVALPLWFASRRPVRAAAGPTRARTAVAAPARVFASRGVSATVPWRLRVMRWSLRVDRRTRVVWAASSAAVSLAFLVAYASMLRRRRSWREGTMQGHRVLMTEDVGPAVVGFFRPRIVIPEWALALPSGERRLMLDHELEHLSAGDPKLLLFAGVVLVLFPWNAALWLMTRRLRLAIEIDCDARVVRGTDAADEYGLFLVAVGERRTHGLFLAASLAERRSSLERRIYAMTSLRPRYPILASLPFAALALGATVLAAQTPTPPAGAGGVISRVGGGPPPADRIQLTNDDMRKLLMSQHAGIANGTSDDNMLTVVLASNGEIVASGSGKVAVAAARAGGSAGGGEGTGVRVLVGTGVPAAGGERRASALKSEGGSAEAGPSSNMIKFPGIGEIDRSLIKDQYVRAYDEGQVSPGRLMVRVVTLTGTAGTLTKK